MKYAVTLHVADDEALLRLSQWLTSEGTRLHDQGVATRSRQWREHWLALAADLHSLSTGLVNAFGKGEQ